jgi:hypothetical protein
VKWLIFCASIEHGMSEVYHSKVYQAARKDWQTRLNGTKEEIT